MKVGRPELLEGALVVHDEIDVVPEQRRDTDAEHDGYEEEDVELSGAVLRQLALPEHDEVFEGTHGQV